MKILKTLSLFVAVIFVFEQVCLAQMKDRSLSWKTNKVETNLSISLEKTLVEKAIQDSMRFDAYAYLKSLWRKWMNVLNRVDAHPRSVMTAGVFHFGFFLMFLPQGFDLNWQWVVIGFFSFFLVSVYVFLSTPSQSSGKDTDFFSSRTEAVSKVLGVIFAILFGLLLLGYVLDGTETAPHFTDSDQLNTKETVNQNTTFEVVINSLIAGHIFLTVFFGFFYVTSSDKSGSQKNLIMPFRFRPLLPLQKILGLNKLFVPEDALSLTSA